MKLSSEIRFVDDTIKDAFYNLEEGYNSDKELFKFVNQALNNIE